MRHKRSTFIFVYGTLRREQPNPYAKQLRASSAFVGLGKMHGRLYHLGKYPGAVYLPGTKSQVVGEVYDTRDRRLVPSLDLYEGILPNDEYYREIVPVKIENCTLRCWSYLLRQVKSEYTLITNGDWLKADHFSR